MIDLTVFGEPTAWWVLGIMAFATTTRSTVGFGEALIAMPLLALLLPVGTAAAYVAMVALVVSLMILGADWQQVRVRSAAGLIIGAWCGIPVGFYLLRMAPKSLVLLVLALVLLGFVAMRVLRIGAAYSLKTDRLAAPFGWAAGVLGGAFNTAGPPVVVFGTMRQWSPGEFRSTIQAFALGTLPAIVFGHWRSGRVDPRVLGLFVGSLPILACAVWLGRILNRRLDAKRFANLVHTLLVCISAALIAQALWS